MSKIISLQILRGFAATIVAGYHLREAAVAEGGAPGLFNVFKGGEIGVDIFFVLSGFIIFFVASNQPSLTRGAFLRARFWRILPPYWVILTLYVLSAVALAVLFGDPSKIPDVGSLITSYLLLPYPDHIIIIAWTLSIELLFYGVFALTFFGGGTRRLVGAMIIWVLASQVMAIFVEDPPSWLVFLLHTAILEFLFGIAIALLVRRMPERVAWLQIPSLVLGATGVSYYLVYGAFNIGPFGRELAAGIPAALLVFGVLGITLQKAVVLETWGESSYALYLFHILYFSIAGTLIDVAFDFNVYHSQWAMVVLLLSVVGICYASTILIERPYQRWYKRLNAVREAAH